MDFPVLKYLDVFIGVAFVMVLSCTVIAAINQMALSATYLRAQYLRQGLADLLRQINSGITPEESARIAQLIQRHPGVARAASIFGVWTAWFRQRFFKGAWLPDGAPAQVVQRHEFLRILLEWAAGEGPLAGSPELAAMTAKIKAALSGAGLAAPVDTFHALQYHTLQQERTHPELPSHEWHTAAAIDSCPATFVGKIHGAYDAMTTRMSERYALRAKIVGSIIAIALVLWLPFDSIELIQRLSADSKLRNEFIARAEELNKQASATPDTQEKASLQDQAKKTKEYVATMDKLGIGETYKDPAGLWAYCQAHATGLLLSWILLSLGTPFWYDALKNALRLRSMVARKDDQDKIDRQRANPDAAPATTDAVPPGAVSVTVQPVP